MALSEILILSNTHSTWPQIPEDSAALMRKISEVNRVDLDKAASYKPS